MKNHKAKDTAESGKQLQHYNNQHTFANRLQVHPDEKLASAKIGSRAVIETQGLENTVFANENIIKVGDNQYLAQGLDKGKGPLTIMQVKTALAQRVVDSGQLKPEDMTEQWINDRTSFRYGQSVDEKMECRKCRSERIVKKW